MTQANGLSRHLQRYHFFLCAEETDRMSKRQAQLTSKDVERQTRRRYTKAFRR